MSARVPVVVLRCSADPFAYGDLGIVRSLGRMRIPVHIAAPGKAPADARSRYGRGRVAVLPSGPPGEHTLSVLLSFARRSPEPPLLIAVDDIAAMFVADEADALDGPFRFPRLPPGLARALTNKKDLFEICKKLDVPTPDAFFPQSREDVVRYRDEGAFPVALKSIDPMLFRFSQGGRSVGIVRRPEDLLSVYDEMQRGDEPNVMLQEYIPGGSASVWMFNGYFDRDSESLLGIPGRKLRQYPASGGVTSLGECVDNPAVIEQTKDLMKAIGYRGILDIGYRFDERDGLYKLLDVNPRVGATFRLFVGASGLDVVRALYADMTGQAMSPDPPVEGRKWIVENFDVSTSLKLRRSGDLRAMNWARSLRGVREAAWFARDDVMPFLTMCARSARFAARVKLLSGSKRKRER